MHNEYIHFFVESTTLLRVSGTNLIRLKYKSVLKLSVLGLMSQVSNSTENYGRRENILA
jgi:hypothetical protein